ncbi:MAG: hypothetical protein R3C19_23550 [Planctomycetaceae bacterium]
MTSIASAYGQSRRVLRIVSRVHPVLVDTDIAARTVALLVRNDRIAGAGLRESLLLQIRQLTQDQSTDDENQRILEALVREFEIGYRLQTVDRVPEAVVPDMELPDFDERLASLRQRYPWPQTIPGGIDANENDHFLTPPTAEVLRRMIDELRPKLIVEVGSWLGGSTRLLLSHSAAFVVAIDTWLGSEEHQPGREWMERHRSRQNVLNRLFETFLVNCWPYRSRLIPLRTCSIDGLHQVARHGLQPNLILLDGAHDFLSVATELRLCGRLFPNANIVVDDFVQGAAWLAGLVRAVEDFAVQQPYELEEHRNQTAILRPS